MPQYDNTAINLVTGKANTTLYKLRQLAEDDVLMRGDDSLDKQISLIALILEAVEWNVDNDFANPETHGLVAYLNHKVSGYNFDATAAYYAAPTVPSGQATSGVARSGYQLFKQLVAGIDDGLVANATSFTDANLIGRYVTVVLDGLILSAGLADRQSYIFNINTGRMDFTAEIAAGSVLTIFTYIPTLSGWTTLAEFVTTSPITAYSNEGMLGKSVAVVVDDLIIPINLPNTLSYTYSPLAAIIAFNQVINTGVSIKIFTY